MRDKPTSQDERQATPVDVLLLAPSDFDLGVLAEIEALGEIRLHRTHNGEEALVLAARPDMALVLSVVAPSDPRGAALIRLVGTTTSDAILPVVFLVTDAKDVEVLHNVAAGAPVDYLLRPLDVVPLRAKIKLYARLRDQQRLIQRQADAIAKESENRFRVMADTAPVYLWMAGTEALCNFFNQSWLAFTGRTMEQELGYGWAEGVHPEDFQHAVDAYMQAFNRREPFTIEYRLRRADGEYRWILDNGVPRFLLGGEFAGYIGSCIDITDRKEVEKERELRLEMEQVARAEAERLRRQAEEASRLKDEFLMTVSHELRTPLNAILGWSSLLVSGDLEPGEDREALATIHRNAEAQLHLINDLLDISRVIVGKLKIERRPVELSPIVKEALEAVRLAVEAKKLSLDFVDDSKGHAVLGDARRLKQVVWNLLANAVKFTPKGGCITIQLQRQRSYAEIMVKDTGIGIEKDFLPYVFDRFRQAEGHTRRQHGGLGLGLAIVRHLIEMHGGQVIATSQGVGKGACFVARLPLLVAAASSEDSEGQMPAAGASETRSARLAGVHVLLVDDDPDALNLVGRVLKHQGAEVRTTSSAREAMELFRQFPPEVLVSDIGMPGMDGHDLVAWLRALGSELSSVPALALTAHGYDEDIQRALDAGFQAHLTKPANPEQIIATVARLVQRGDDGPLQARQVH